MITEAPPSAGATGRLGYLPSLDGIRAVAVLLVMGYHAGITGVSGGNAGVDVFFVLSGFLITTLLLEEWQGTGRVSLRSFWMRRILRLYPALLVASVLALGLTVARVPVFGAGFESFWGTLEFVPFVLLYAANVPRALGWSGGGYLGHTWSLSIEEQFYLVWPMVTVLVLRRRAGVVVLGWVALGCAMGSAAARAVLDLGGADFESLYNNTFTHVDGIFAGCALAVMRRQTRHRFGLLASGRWTVLTTLVAAVIVVRGENMNLYGFAVVVLCAVAALAHVVEHPGGVIARGLSSSALVETGRRSYGLYLYHWPIFLFVGIDNRPHILFVAFGLSFLAAWASYRWIEQPFLRRKGRWATKTPAGSPNEGVPGR